MPALSGMYVCPHCKAQAVEGRAARWSSRESPATCGACQGLSHVASSSSSGIRVLTFVLALVSLGGALVSPWWTLAGVGLTVVYNCWAWKQVELFPITAESARNSSKASWWTHGLSLLALLMS